MPQGSSGQRTGATWVLGYRAKPRICRSSNTVFGVEIGSLSFPDCCLNARS